MNARLSHDAVCFLNTNEPSISIRGPAGVHSTLCIVRVTRISTTHLSVSIARSFSLANCFWEFDRMHALYRRRDWQHTSAVCHSSAPTLMTSNSISAAHNALVSNEFWQNFSRAAAIFAQVLVHFRTRRAAVVRPLTQGIELVLCSDRNSF